MLAWFLVLLGIHHMGAMMNYWDGLIADIMSVLWNSTSDFILSGEFSEF